MESDGKARAPKPASSVARSVGAEVIIFPLCVLDMFPMGSMICLQPIIGSAFDPHRFGSADVFPRGRTSAVDVRVPHRIRLAGLAQRISQREAAEALGVTFQQVQIYENANWHGKASSHCQFSEPLHELFFPKAST